ncbi:class I SAM-dependent methyltransferase [Halomonas salinarum]|uniref:class I SAM-dependent methyltransferase n=1 Tax=Halomonas salinarum TaxID=1158993 RepID=UPI0014389AF5|nr:class I SAM-dependent methyltransferase [Halomonas salinarum]
MTQPLSCPLCDALDAVAYHRDACRDYVQCQVCKLVFVPSHQHLAADAERAVYDQHQNSPQDAGYRRFLSRLQTPLQARLTAGAEGLDVGSGPGPTLSVMFEEAGYPMAVYDPFFAPDRAPLSRRYDFITATEVVEHMAAPGVELTRLAGLLRPGGWLGLMTKRVTRHEIFVDWHYILDPTHVCFFSEASFHWLAERLAMEVIFPDHDVVLLKRSSS